MKTFLVTQPLSKFAQSRHSDSLQLFARDSLLLVSELSYWSILLELIFKILGTKLVIIKN